MRDSKPSYTAAKVARNVVFAGQLADYAVILPEGAVDETERLLVAAGYLRPWMQRLLRSRRLPRLIGVGDRLSPGAHFHLAIRRRYMDDGIQTALEDGATQVLIAGAGFDTVGQRTAARRPDVTVVELDHPATQELKRKAVSEAGPAPPNLHFVAADVSRFRLPSVLGTCRAWNPEARTVVVAEGLLMYLAERAVGEMLAGLAESTGPGTRLLITYLPLDDQDRPPVGVLTRAVLRIIGEPWLWGIRPDEFEGFLEVFGWSVTEAPDVEELRKRYLEPVGLSDRPVMALERVATLETAD